MTLRLRYNNCDIFCNIFVSSKGLELCSEHAVGLTVAGDDELSVDNALYSIVVNACVADSSMMLISFLYEHQID